MTLATSDVQSRAELYLFELLRRGLSDEYTVVHGARWELPSNAIISTGGNGEADFVVLHPMKGIIVIEAKAGFVEYSPITGKWTIDGGTGSPRRSKRGPLEQAQGNRHALEYALRRAFPEMPRVKLCYAVAVPECTYDMALEPLGLPRSLFLDSAGCANVAVWISGVYEHFGPDGDVISEYVLDLLITLMAGSIQFSSPIKSQMALAHKTIEQLTQNQYHIIKFLTGHRRVAISGCAGSGKTLVAVEKAIRLDRAGLRTMLLCHNPLLADYLRGLTTNTGVVVEDFGSWIGLLTGRSLYEIRNWTHYDEPDGKELAIAFDKLHASRQKYDAIVVDEGQDFRDEWWLLVQVALADQQFGTLYIFHDDNQALLPFRSQYPIEEAPYCLSQNCRNAGEIFELVRRFHPQAPEPSLYLKNQGRIRFQPCTPAEELGAITQAVLWAIETLATEDLVVLTTEADPVEQSHLNGVQVELTPSWKWQDAVYPLLRRIESALGRDTDATAPIQPHTLPKLSGDSYPTSDDVSAVVRFVRSHYPIRFRGKRLEAGHYGKLKWRVGADGLSLNLALPSPGFLGNFFQSEHWADGIPKPRVIKLSCSAAKGDSESIRLVTASGFKGLEADGVILFVWSYRGDLDSNLYVGLSRARLLLCVVAEPTTIARIQSIKSPG